MKIFFLVLSLIAPNILFAKTDNPGFRHQEWQMLTGAAVLISYLPYKPTKVTEADIDSVVYCRQVDGKIRALLVLTREIYEHVAEENFDLYCDDDGLRLNRP